MADLIKEQEVLQEEQKKSKKVLYKNWKTYAIALGIVVIGTGVGLGIYYGVNANNAVATPSEQNIADAITGQTYQAAAVTVGSDTNSITNQITPNFIENNLADNIKNAFKAESFSLDSVTVVDQGTTRALAKSDLNEARTFNATINYKYGAIAGKTTLKITVTALTEADIVKAIADLNYTVSVSAGSETDVVIKQITGDFIKNGIENEQINKAFLPESFALKTIMIGDHELIKADLENPSATALDAKINYTYGSTAGITNLKINVKTELATIIKTKTINSSNANTETSILTEITKQNSGLSQEDITITDLQQATTKIAGSATIVAKEESKFTGEVSIEISTLPEVTDANLIAIFNTALTYTSVDTLTDIEITSTSVQDVVTTVQDTVPNIVLLILGDWGYNSDEINLDKITVSDQILVDGHELSEADLVLNGETIKLNITFNYGAEKTNLILNGVKDSE